MCASLQMIGSTESSEGSSSLPHDLTYPSILFLYPDTHFGVGSSSMALTEQ